MCLKGLSAKVWVKSSTSLFFSCSRPDRFSCHWCRNASILRTGPASSRRTLRGSLESPHRCSQRQPRRTRCIWWEVRQLWQTRYTYLIYLLCFCTIVRYVYFILIWRLGNRVTSPGSIPEEDGGKLYNTCTVFGPDGQLLLKHRKVCSASPALVCPK